MLIRKFILATAVAGSLVLFTAGAAGASSNGETVKTVLDELCDKRGGMPVYSPYSIARCQGARANKAFEIEQLICEDLADGRLVVTNSTTHKNRVSWACIATSPAT